MLKLSEKQTSILTSACKRDDGLAQRPTNLKPAAAGKIVAALRERGFVREIRAKVGAPIWREDGDGKGFSLKVLKAGRDAIESVDPEQAGILAKREDEVGVDANEKPENAMVAGASYDLLGSRPGSKRALIIGMLQSPEGTSINALMDATGWLPHTTRAALSGLRKAGLLIERSRSEPEGSSIYRIVLADESAKAA